MTRSFLQEERQSCELREITHPDVSKLAHAQERRSLFTLRTADAIFAAGMLVGHSGIDDDDLCVLGNWNGLDSERARVDEESVTAIGQARRELVHDADRYAYELVFRLP